MARQTHLSPMALSAQLRTFSPKAVTIPDSEGLHWTLPPNRIDFGLPANRLDFILPANRLDYVLRTILVLLLTGW